MQSKPAVARFVALVLALHPAASFAQNEAERWTGDRLPPGSRIAFAVGRFDPQLSVEGDSREGSHAGGGALHGAHACMQGGTPAAIALACLPFGLLIGAIAGSSGAATQETTSEAQGKLAEASKALALPPALASRVASYVRSMGIEGPGLLYDQGPLSAADDPRYPATAGDYVVEIALTEIRATTPASAKVPYRFIVVARGRLVRVADNTIVDTFTKRVGTNLRTVDNWTANGNALMTLELNAIMATLAEAYADEWVLLHRGTGKAPVEEPPKQESSPFPTAGVSQAAMEQKLAPDYVLRPVDPPASASLRLSTSIMAFHMTAAPVASLTPTLTWERLPRTMLEPANLTYDVRILEGAWHPHPMASGGRVFRAFRPVRVFTGLKEPKVEVNQALQPCKTYFWTVRARFDLDGRRRTTEWSGGYLTVLGDIDPASIRRPAPAGFFSNRSFFPQSAHYFPFKTPDADGKECTEIK
jgi:hypothetical protein